MASVIPYFTTSSSAFFITLNDRYDRPFQARRSVEGLCSITLKIHGIWVLGLLSDHHDKQTRQTVVAMTIRHELCNPTLRSYFPIFLQQLHYDTTYRTSEARRTVKSPIGGNFSAFLAQKHSFSSLDKFPINEEKLT